jgi:uncharacterized protein (DUF58 family)
VHGRRRGGPGDEFWQYRAYAPGDAATSIDWRKSARAERLFVRETEWMAANTLWLWVQQDAGMRWHSHLVEEEKERRALTLALALARLAQRAGERAGIIGAPFAPDHTRAAFERMARYWLARQRADAAEAEAASLPPRARVPRFSSLVLIGDFFAAPEELMRRMVALAGAGVRGHLLQVVDPAEETFPYEGRVRFADMRGARTFLSERAEDLRAAYRRRLASLRAELGAQARRLGWTFAVHRTDAPPQTALLALWARLADAPMATGAHEPAPHGAGEAA